MPDEINDIDNAVNRFIRKVSPRNEPLEAFRETDQWLAFQAALKAGVAAQYQYVIDHKANWPKLEMPEPSEAQLATWLGEIGKWLDSNLPSSTANLDQEQVFELFKEAFNYSCRAQLLRLGLLKKAADPVEFELTNQHYIDALNNDAAYLLNTKSTAYDQTTKDRLIGAFKERKLQNDTIDEVADYLNDNFDEISSVRAFMIANTETANAMGQGSQAWREESGIPTKRWVIAGPHNLTDECDDNEADGDIPNDQEFSSGDMYEPAHTSCECYVDSGEINLDTIDIWSGE